MAPHLTDDTRTAALSSIIRKDSTSDIAKSLNISERQVTRMKSNYKKHGTTKNAHVGKRTGRPKALDKIIEARLAQFVDYRPAAHLKQLQSMVQEEYGKSVSTITIARILKNVDFERKRYTSELPASIPIDPSIPQFFETFYQISDTPGVHDQYAASFTDDATLIMASKKAQGKEEILSLRRGMWEAVTSRSHNPIKIFPFGPNSTEVMIYGTVKYVFKDGGKDASKDWAARANLVQADDGSWRMKFYQVYLDTK